MTMVAKMVKFNFQCCGADIKCGTGVNSKYCCCYDSLPPVALIDNCSLSHFSSQQKTPARNHGSPTRSRRRFSPEDDFLWWNGFSRSERVRAPPRFPLLFIRIRWGGTAESLANVALNLILEDLRGFGVGEISRPCKHEREHSTVVSHPTHSISAQMLNLCLYSENVDKFTLSTYLKHQNLVQMWPYQACTIFAQF